MAKLELVGRTEISLEVSYTLGQDVETYALRHGIPWSDALRYLIEAGLASEAEAMAQQSCEWPLDLPYPV